MRKLVIIGGRGQMGRMFGRWLQADYQVQSLDLDNGAERERLLADADVAIVSVPLHDTTEVIGGLRGCLPPSALLADFTSVKAMPLAAMLAVHAGPVLGLHPMFGPGVESLRGQTIVACAGRDRERAQPLLDSLQRQGARVVECDAEEHDHMMTVVQAIRHFVTFALGSFLATEHVDVTRSLDFASPVYRLEINMVSRLLAQDPALYTDIILATPERREMISRLAAHYTELARLVADGDRDALLAQFAAARDRFAQEAERALRESNLVIETLSRQRQRT